MGSVYTICYRYCIPIYVTVIKGEKEMISIQTKCVDCPCWLQTELYKGLCKLNVEPKETDSIDCCVMGTIVKIIYENKHN